ncbi:NfeD family protein [Teichococcus oryzae]|uniref:NfeD family protein n=1 Tax=Teichococcus oryzae TaxID=1608942 RepID=A0A5B2THL9_9PROT|nr:NfeD family protein [Pseudoroseomonas oryzae]KAA2213679.1 NfeD family protein [Pseudoroseomonas oryzae]
MPAWSLWLAAGLLLMAAELLLPGAFLVWIGAAALGTGLVLALLPMGFIPTALVFIALLAAGVALGLRAFRPTRPRGALNTPGAGLIGRTGVLLGNGRVRVGDSDWPARGAGEAGAVVEVVAVEGMTLLVRPVASGEGAAFPRDPHPPGG